MSLLAQMMMINIRHVKGKALKHEAAFSAVDRSQHLVTQTPLCCIKENQQFGRNTEMRRQSRWRLPARFSLYRAAVGAAFNTNDQFYSIWKTAWIFFFKYARDVSIVDIISSISGNPGLIQGRSFCG